jgi:SAM-dependent methyltransferase
MKNKHSKQLTMAQSADRHALYEASVQDTEAELEFIEQTFQSITGRPLKLLREDFCGTANTACAWVEGDPDRHAVAIDLDLEVLNWGRDRHYAGLTPSAQSRIDMIHADVLSVSEPKVDCTIAMNFSYYLFKTRDALRGYFEHCLRGLKSDGLLIMDSFGGFEAHRELEESTEYDNFTYIWDQHAFDPITHDIVCQIHFEFPDGSKLKRAFEYHWRLWSLPEIQELLLEAGFRDVGVYWEGTDEQSGEGDGVYRRQAHGEADAGWIAYLVARP